MSEYVKYFKQYMTCYKLYYFKITLIIKITIIFHMLLNTIACFIQNLASSHIY